MSTELATKGKASIPQFWVLMPATASLVALLCIGVLGIMNQYRERAEGSVDFAEQLDIVRRGKLEGAVEVAICELWELIDQRGVESSARRVAAQALADLFFNARALNLFPGRPEAVREQFREFVKRYSHTDGPENAASTFRDDELAAASQIMSSLDTLVKLKEDYYRDKR